MRLDDRIQTILDRGVNRGDVAGAVAQVVGSGNLRGCGAAGLRALERAGAMTLDTVFWLASMTKPVTGVAAMQLVERGLLELDAPASRWYPWLGEVGVLEGFDSDGRPRIRPARGVITLRNLLTHTSGFGYDIWNTDLLRFVEEEGQAIWEGGEHPDLRTPLVFDPEARWEYGVGIDHVGRMVEAASGRGLGEYMRSNIFEPLGMSSTGFGVTPDMRERLAGMHRRRDDGTLATQEMEIEEEPRFQMGGGGLYGTVEDYSRFLQMFLNGGQAGEAGILRPETIEMMAANHMGDHRVTPLRTAMPPISRDVEFFPGVEKSWGLTFQINEDPLPTGRPTGGLMWAGIANTFFWLDLRNGIAGIYASQMYPFGDERTYGLFQEVEAAAYECLD